MQWLLVAAGGALGALARYGLYGLRIESATVTLAINLTGSLLLGLVAASGPPSPVRLLVAVGFLGAFTTLSTFSLETLQMLDDGRTGMAALLVAGTAVGGPLCAYLGYRMG